MKRLNQIMLSLLACGLIIENASAAAASDPVIPRQTPFVSVPYYMQLRTINKTTPNLMLLFDNSESMEWSVSGDPWGRSRNEIAKSVTRSAIRKYRDKFRIGLATLNDYDDDMDFKYWDKENGKEQFTEGYHDVVGAESSWYNTLGYIMVPIEDSTDDHIKKMDIILSRMLSEHLTPNMDALRTIYAYMGGEGPYHPNPSYTCPSNNLGLADENTGTNSQYLNCPLWWDEMNRYWINNFKTQPTARSKSFFTYAPAWGVNSVPRSKVPDPLTIWDHVKDDDANSGWLNENNSAEARIINGFSKEGAVQDPDKIENHADVRASVRRVMQYRCQQNHVLLISDGASDQDHDFPFLSPSLGNKRAYAPEFAYNHDYRPEGFKIDKFSWDDPTGKGTGGTVTTDKDGKSWDDPYFPKQNIITHAISFMSGPSNVKNIVEKGGGAYIITNSGDGLDAAFDAILGIAQVQTPDYVQYSQITFTNNSAIFESDETQKEANFAPVVAIDPPSWSSSIQFKKMDSTSPSGFEQDGAKKDKIVYPITANYNNSVFLATLPNRDAKGNVVSGSKLYDLSQGANPLSNSGLNNNYFSLNDIYKHEHTDLWRDCFGTSLKEAEQWLCDYAQPVENIDPNNPPPPPNTLTDPDGNPTLLTKIESNGKKPLTANRWWNGYLYWLLGKAESYTSTSGTANYQDDYASTEGNASNIWGSDRPDYRVRSRLLGQTPDDAMKRKLGEITGVNIGLLGDMVESSRNKSNLGSVFTQANGKAIKLPRYMVLQANDGMAHIYTADHNFSGRPYLERFRYMPGAILRENNRRLIEDIAIRAYRNYGSNNVPRESYLDGPINYYTTTNVKGDQIRHFFIGNAGQGGRGLYALNIGGKDDVDGKTNVGITDASTGSTNTGSYQSNAKDKVLLWDTSTDAFGAAGEINDMGYTLNNALVKEIALQRQKTGNTNNNSETINIRPNYAADTLLAAFSTNGYGYPDTSQKPKIYVFDALGFSYDREAGGMITQNVRTNNGKPGRLVRTIEVSSADAGAVLGDLHVMDLDNDLIADVIYVGDSNGDLHRIHLNVDGNIETSAQFESYKVFDGDPKQPITAAPNAYYRGGTHAQVVFGTGRNYLESDRIDQDTDFGSLAEQSFYSLLDKISAPIPPNQPVASYANRDTTLLERELSEGEMTDDQGNKRKARNFTDNKILNSNQHKGWFINLMVNGKKDGERIVNRPLIVNKTVFFSSETGSIDLPSDYKDLMCVGATYRSIIRNYQVNVIKGSPAKPGEGDASLKAFHFGKDMAIGVYADAHYSNLISATGVSHTIDGGTNTNGIIRLWNGGKPPPPPTCEELAMAQAGQDGADVTRFECSPVPRTIKRISWREIF
ncbi:PilC/PilY family type IV pilus protein [Stenoxybacter acetivorans]|uniref:PilC/PilY family type IV pilus protein n=1 Tax=Stenoxybacter acetivorans TaxID=422441 RepID=UPI0014705B86|nr:PilC/PilY family type IV pilus protein [Stenoxybacter acetivorans]